MMYCNQARETSQRDAASLMKLPWLLLHPIWCSVCLALCENEQLLLSKQANPLQMLPQYWVGRSYTLR